MRNNTNLQCEPVNNINYPIVSMRNPDFNEEHISTVEHTQQSAIAQYRWRPPSACNFWRNRHRFTIAAKAVVRFRAWWQAMEDEEVEVDSAIAQRRSKRWVNPGCFSKFDFVNCCNKTVHGIVTYDVDCEDRLFDEGRSRKTGQKIPSEMTTTIAHLVPRKKTWN